MTEKAVVATPETTVREAAILMRGHAVNCLPVLDGQKLAGVITALDLLELIGRGAERPVAKTKRPILKDRGQRPHRQTAAKTLNGSAGAARR
jgi:CBS domain-containing protein